MKDSVLKRKLLLPLIATSFLGSAGLSMTAHGAKLLFEDGFENYSLDKWRYSGTRGSLTNSPTRSGNYAMQFSLDRTKSKVPYRSEIVINKGKNIFKMGEEYWVGASIFIPNNWAQDPHYGEILLQFHEVPDKHLGETWRNPPLGLRIKGNNWQVNNCWDSKPLTKNKNYEGCKGYNLGSYKKGQWTDWVFRIKWSYKQDGILEVWKDGQRVVSQNGPNTFNDQVAPYLKIGLYKSAWIPGQNWAKKSSPVNTRTAYYDEIRIARGNAGYNAVAPGKRR